MASEAEKLAKKIFGANIVKSGREKDKHLSKKYKIVVFVPFENTDELTFAMASAGAGRIGNYSVCSFRMKGVGTFMGVDGSNPVIGSKGKFEMAEEVRLEMICDKRDLKNAIERMYEVHPYDEPAFEIYEVLTGTKKPSNNYLRIPLNKKIKVKNVLKHINSSIKTVNLPGKLNRINMKECIIDLRDNIKTNTDSLQKNILYIIKSNNKIKAYFI